MAKTTAKRRTERKTVATRRPWWKSIAIIAVVVSLAASMGVLAAFRPLSPSSKPAISPKPTAPPTPAQSQPPLSLAKEYVYAGGKLIATEEGGSEGCTGIAISPASKNFGPAAGSDTIAVTTGCAWTATASPAGSWITIDSGASGSGNGTVSYSVQQNTGGSRPGSITISGGTFSQTCNITQDGPNAASFISQQVPTSMTPGQQVSVSITMQNTGTSIWTTADAFKLGSQNPQDNMTWGLNRVALPNSVAPNATVTLTFTVTAPATTGNYNFQWKMLKEGVEWFGTPSTNVVIAVTAPSSCSTSQLTPTERTHTAPPQTDSVEVTADPSCNWTADRGGNSWITITPPGTGTGNGTFQYSITQNPGPLQRIGTIQVAGKTFTVRQNPPCSSYSLSPTANPSVGEGGVSGVNFTVFPERSDCIWHASTGDSWIHCDTSGHMGNMSVSYVVDPNPGFARSGKITVFGEGDQIRVDFNISQAGIGNSAAYVNQNVPTSLYPGQFQTVSVTMRNAGANQWTGDPPNPYLLHSQNPEGNVTWGMSDVPLPMSVPSGSTVTFTFTITAPSTEGVYNFQWQMYKPGVGVFGQTSLNVPITVSGSASVPAPSNLQATAQGLNVTLTWQNNIPPNFTKIERRVNGGAWGQIGIANGAATSYFDSSVPAGNYSYRVRCEVGNGTNSPYSNEASLNVGGTAPNPVTNLSLSLGPGLSVNVQWTDNSTNESGFRIDRKNGALPYSMVGMAGAGVTSYLDTSVAANTTYWYQVTAVNGTFDAPPPNPEQSITTGPPPPPAAPTNLALVSTTTSQVNMTFQDNATNEDSFKVDRKTGTGSFSEVLTLPAGSGTISFSDTTVSPSTQYSYQVRAFNTGGGTSPPSNLLVVTTPDPSSPPTPINLVATAASSSQINLSWAEQAGSNEDGFKIERKTGAGSFSEIQQVGMNVHSFSDTGLSASTTYTYRVRAFSGPLNSGYSNEQPATTFSSGPPCATVSAPSGSGTYGYAEGNGTAAQWRKPVGGVVAKDPQTNLNALFIADTENHRIRKVMLEGGSAGTSSLIAGEGIAGYSDGAGKVRYNFPRGISAFVNGSGVVTKLVIADTSNHAIRQLTWSGSAWVSALFAGSTTGVAGNVDGSPTTALFNSPQAIVVAPDGFAYVADTGNKKVRKLTSSGTVSTLAGGVGWNAPVGIAADGTSGGPLYVSDSTNNQIYQVSTSTGSVISIAGSATAGYADGTGANALFNAPGQLVWTNPATGPVLFIADQGNNRIRRLVLGGVGVFTHAGNGTAGFVDGSCTTAQFNAPRGMAYFVTTAAVYAIDTNNNRIRKLQ